MPKSQQDVPRVLTACLRQDDWRSMLSQDATSSLLQAIGGPRNGDYGYAWIRDAAFSVYALQWIGLPTEAVADQVKHDAYGEILD